MIYIYLIIILFLFGSIIYYTIPDKTKADNLFLICSFFPVSLVAGFRAETVGVDTASYIRFFEIVNNYSFSEVLLGRVRELNSIENGYLFWNRIVGAAFSNSQSIIIVNSFLIIFLFFILIKKHSSNVFFSVILFITGGVYFLSFNLVRQLLACGLLLNSLSYFESKKYFKTLILFSIAVSFHLSSFVFVIVYLTRYFKFSKKSILFIIILLAVFVMEHDFFINTFSTYTGIYSRYLNNTGLILEVGGVTIIWILEAIISLIAIFVIADNSDDGNKIKFYGLMVLIYVSISFIGLNFNYIDRLGIYFRSFSIFLLPLLIEINKRNRHIYYYGLINLMVPFYLLSGLTSQQLNYSFFWSV